MPIGSSKIGVLGAGTVPGGTSTFNASGTFTVPPGVTRVNITGKGGTGNSGNPGNAGNSGNPGTGGAGGSGGFGRILCACAPPANANTPGGAGGLAFKRFCYPGNAFVGPQGGPFGNNVVRGGGGGSYYTSPAYNPGSPNCPGPGQTGCAGTAGQAGQAGAAGNPGQSSSGLCKTFPGGSGGAAGNAGAAGTAGNGGTGGTQGCNGPTFVSYTPLPSWSQNKAGGAGGNGAGAGGSSFVVPNPQDANLGWAFGGRGGGGASASADGTSANAFPTSNAPWAPSPVPTNNVVAYWPGGRGGFCPANPNTLTSPFPIPCGPFPLYPCATPIWGTPYPCGMNLRAGGHGGGSKDFLGLNPPGCNQTTGFGVPVAFIKQSTTNTPFPCGQAWVNVQKGVYRWPSQVNAQAIPSNNNLFRAGGGGGAGNIKRAFPVGPNSPFPSSEATRSGGGGGGGRGNAGGAGGAGGTGGAGQAATPQTFNCVPVTPGGSYPITVASPGGQVVISWNPQ